MKDDVALQAAQMAYQIRLAEAQLKNFKQDYRYFRCTEEYNEYGSLEDAAWAVEDMLESFASEDCEGSRNKGKDEYSANFKVGDKKYLGTLRVEYNRHDKTYYYVEETSFNYEEV